MLNIADHGARNRLVCDSAVFANETGNIVFRGSDNELILGANICLRDIHLEFGDRSHMTIGRDCVLQTTYAYLLADAAIDLQDGVSATARLRLQLHEPGRITIGEQSLLASDVEISNSDMHSILSLQTGQRLNPARDVTIGPRVWIGQRALILKGATIGADTVIAAGAIVTGPIPPQVVAGGIPARVIREGVRWDRRLL